MSRRGRVGRHARTAKYWTPPPAPSVVMPVTVESLPALTLMETQVLTDGRLAVWAGDPLSDGATTGEIASLLWIRARTSHRQELNDTLTSMRKAGLLKFEYDRMLDQQARWWLTAKGAEVGHALGAPADQSSSRSTSSVPPA